MLRLTPREQEVLELIAEEMSSSEIATQLQISIKTVESHRKNIMLKTQSRNMAGLVTTAIRLGLVNGYAYIG